MEGEDEEDVWRTPPWLYPCLLTVSAALLLYRSRILSPPKDVKDKDIKSSSPFISLLLPAPFLFLQRRFLAFFFLASAVEDLQLVYGESYLEYKGGFTRSEIALYFVIAHLASLFIGPFLGILADHIGRKKACLIYCLMQIFGALLKKTSPSLLWSGGIFQGLATTLLSSTFESWFVTEHEKSGFRQEWINNTFWLMSFGAAVVAIGSAGLANFVVAQHSAGMAVPTIIAALGAGLVALGIFFLWEENTVSSHGRFLGTVRATFRILHDKKVMALGCAHASLNFANTVFWFLWTPTLVADGRGIHAGMLFPALMACQMLGSAISAMVLSGPWNIHPEDFLRWIFVSAALAFAVPAYDYQEIGVLAFVFCVFHISYGIAWPLLARLRSLYIPAEHRAGIITLFQVPANAISVFVLVNGSMFQRLENNKIFGLSIAGLFAGGYCLHILHRLRQQSHEKVSNQRP